MRNHYYSGDTIYTTYVAHTNSHNKCYHRPSSNNALEFTDFNNQLISNLRYSFLKITKYLHNSKKKTLNRFALLCHDKSAERKYNPKFEQWYSYVLDITDAEFFKPSHIDNNTTKKCPQSIFTVMFCNIKMEQINLNRIWKLDGSIAHLPEKIQLQENIPVATFRLKPIIRNKKNLNYKEAVQLIIEPTKFHFWLLLEHGIVKGLYFVTNIMAIS